MAEALSPLIEFLQYQQKPSGEQLTLIGGSYVEVPAFPPNTTVVVSQSPGEGEVAWILFSLTFDPSIVPRAFQCYLQKYGARSYDGLLTSGPINFQHPTLTVVTKTQKSFMSIRNTTNLAQYFAMQTLWLTVNTDEDYDLIKDIVRRYGVSARSEALAAQANTLLAQLLTAQGIQPAITPEPRAPVARR